MSDEKLITPDRVALVALYRENEELWRMVERLRTALNSGQYVVKAADELLERRAEAKKQAAS